MLFLHYDFFPTRQYSVQREKCHDTEVGLCLVSSFTLSWDDNAGAEYYTDLYEEKEKEKGVDTMVKNWSKGTKPLVSEQANTAQEASSGQSLLSLVLKMGPDTEASRSFLLRVVQPGLSGLMDGSVSTLAPIFATAFATHRPFTAFLVGRPLRRERALAWPSQRRSLTMGN